jgi:hypothetical protein
MQRALQLAIDRLDGFDNQVKNQVFHAAGVSFLNYS